MTLSKSLTTEYADRTFLIVAQFDRMFNTIETDTRQSLHYAEKCAKKLLASPQCIAVTIFEFGSYKTIAHAYWPEEDLPND